MSTLFEMDETPVKDKSSGDNEWYTPGYLIEAVRKTLGDIDLDPASCIEANQTVRARKIYTKEEGGLSQPWTLDGKPTRVFLNPPYGLIPISPSSRVPNWQGKSAMWAWTTRLIDEYRQGNVAQAILLTKSDPKEKWFQVLWDYPICFMINRVLFNRPGKEPEKHQFGTALAYFGQNEQTFVDVFTQFGPVVTPDGVHRRPSPVHQPSLFDLEAL